MKRASVLALTLALLALAPAAFAMPGAGAQAGGNMISGLVAETMDAGGYTYVLVETGSDMIWAAGPTTPMKVGDRIRFSAAMPMQDFHSAALDRDFKVIYFTGALTHEGAPAQAAPAPKAAASAPVEAVAAPEGGYSIAELYAQRDALAGKTVTLRGRVVKVNNSILGRNWLHLQDGSGSVEARNHDLVVTSQSTAKRGDVVTATGVLAKDKDFGSGYFFALILEETALSAD